MVECMKKHIITIIAGSLILIAAIVTTVVLVVKNKDGDNKEEDIVDIAILLKDSELKKPNNKINAEFELVKMRNGLAGMLISDPYADKSHIQFTMKYGSYIDTDGGISHLESIWCYKEVKNMIHYIHFLTNFSELKMLI